jgi:hypothetical protein
MSGSAIIELERNEDVSIFNGFKTESNLHGAIPRTKEQVDVDMNSDLSGVVRKRTQVSTL